tara:strand:- start:2232 stop:2420 length:189 start_codon:yes stop_codon:yes gene_type:complete
VASSPNQLARALIHNAAMLITEKPMCAYSEIGYGMAESHFSGRLKTTPTTPSPANTRLNKNL